ncbi:DUF3578 domain-containing protein [Halanaerobiaceae bacterium Z-7014]|uniref:DUF3578 domain-containing protein n=1 Tax=Halonatronomonas betaini TaxID=2778430 RepID=A0A931F9M9_9FIRM|nr:DUF3578 domain-containing protein [Halonatronomonas betaini]MBF8436092.1 DUF3578 domain-containing protein [Halonatronomonas betaini]
METLLEYFQKIMEEYQDARREERFSGHELGDILRNELPDLLKKIVAADTNFNQDKFLYKGSIGQGNWAYVPWLAILNKNITTTTQEGVYIVYLFSEDMERLYLTLNQGVTKTANIELKKVKQELRDDLYLEGLNTDDNIDLAESVKGSEYEDSTIAYLKYNFADIQSGAISEDKLKADLKQLLNIYDQYASHYEIVDQPDESKENEELEYLDTANTIVRIENYIKAQGFTYPDDLIKNFYLSLKTKSFVILAGISGTGKTKLVQLFAEAIGCTTENNRFKLISVRPDWSDSSDLLGYTDIQGEFQPGPLIETIRMAVEESKNSTQENPAKPYIICLDEMNLARVEYYFSDFLSKMETRKFNSKGKLTTDKLISKSDLGNNEDTLNKYGELYLPDNLHIIGTVNMDETTHPFSKKVLDRANTIEFNRIDLMAFSSDSDLDKEDIESMLIDNHTLRTEYLNLIELLPEKEAEIVETTRILQDINKRLKPANLQVGYRIRDEINFYMIYNKRHNLMDFNKALDYQIHQKILPRIQGSSRVLKDILLDLFEFTAGGQFSVEQGEQSSDLKDHLISNYDDIKYYNSAKKIAEMIERYEQDGFTAFWL